jgi:hypothetical protein
VPLQPSEQFVQVGLPGTDLADVDHLRPTGVRVGDRDVLLVNVQAHEKSGRLCPG